MNEKNQNLQNGNEQNQTGESQEKVSLKDRIAQGYHKFRATKVGKWTVRVVKGGAVVGGLYTSFRAGQKSVKPTVVTIEHNAEEPVEEEETPAEEPAEEQTAE